MRAVWTYYIRPACNIVYIIILCIYIRVWGGYTHTVACTRTTDIMLNDVWHAPALHYVSKEMGRRKTSRSLFIIIIIIIILLAAPRQRLNADYGSDRYTRRRRRLGWDAGKNKEWEKKYLTTANKGRLKCVTFKNNKYVIFFALSKEFKLSDILLFYFRLSDATTTTTMAVNYAHNIVARAAL